MEKFSAWIISIAGICLLSVIIDLMLPSGKTNEHIKKVISYAVALVVLLPIPSFFGSKLEIENFFNNQNLEVQDNFIYDVNQNKLDTLSKEIEVRLNDNGILGVEISISANVFDVDMEIDAVYVDLYNMVIKENEGNINIKKKIIDTVESVTKIEKERIIFYE